MAENRSIKVRYDNLFIPAGAIKLCASNAGDLETEFLPKGSKKYDVKGMMRRITSVHCPYSLVAPRTNIPLPSNPAPPMQTPVTRPPPSIGGVSEAGGAWDRLEKIMEWKSKGWLTGEEFERAKQKCLFD